MTNEHAEGHGHLMAPAGGRRGVDASSDPGRLGPPGDAGCVGAEARPSAGLVDRRRLLRRAGIGLGVWAGASVVGSRALGRGDRPWWERDDRRAPGDGSTLDLSDAETIAVVVPAPRIVTRAEWGADETLRDGVRSFAPVRKLVVHHSATAVDADPTVTLRSIHRFHFESRGWSDIAYNFLIDPAGVVYEGRWARDHLPGELHAGEASDGRGVVGAHTLDHNTGSMGVCLLGTYTAAAPSDAAVRSLVSLLAWRSARSGIDPLGDDLFTNGEGITRAFPNLCGHRDLGVTSCPGGVTHAMLPSLRVKVAARLRSGIVGYRILASDGVVSAFGEIDDVGDPARAGLRGPFAAVAAVANDPGGYWVAGTDGGLFAFGSAGYHRSLPELGVRTRVVDLASTPTGRGYWMLGRDGGVFSFGDAGFHGSVPGVGVASTVLKLRPTPSGAGYWVLGLDGGVFSFGDAGFYGSVPGVGVRTRVVDLWPTSTGRGYWVLGGDGGVFSFGDAGFLGSLPGLNLAAVATARALVGTTTGAGYYVLSDDGGIFTFGDAPFLGSAGGLGLRTRGASALGVAVAVQP